MKKKNLLATLLLVAVAFTLASCGDRLDGDWDPMKWRADVPVDKEHKVQVPSQGGTYTFTCTNYSSIWLGGGSVKEDGVYLDRPDGIYHIAGTWSDSKVEKNVLTITLQPNATGKRRVLEVHPTAGDIFARFIFEQE
ncbi:hypothetical protein [Prevotella sp. KH2C16]|uniref:hypothetical protein n=1 Tax=Prevotella sp. KH2C16 TaxID=1855325 RepID=UPI0008E125C6|nr:hypothetical protein [Prevotella sp. KH2C16]SFG17825.1 hypothetical protein SAMN05216383_106118 [Prevotella sp. KH2C16]